MEILEFHQLMSISNLATTGETTPRTVRLLGHIGNLEVLVLVDYGSSHSFISEAVAAQMQSQVVQMAPMAVKIADGGTLSCSGYIPACTWETQQHNSPLMSGFCHWDVTIWSSGWTGSKSVALC